MCRCGSASEHQHLAVPAYVEKTLHPYIDHARSTLNHDHDPALRRVVRESFPADQRFTVSSTEGIILALRFIDSVRIKTVMLHGCAATTAPRQFSLFVNPKLELDFSIVNTFKPSQAFVCAPYDPSNYASYSTRVAFFDKVRALAVYVPKIDGHEVAMNYLGFTGEFLQVNNKAVHASYELRPQLADHLTEHSKMSFNNLHI